MSDLTHYRTQVTELGKRAVAAEAEKNWEEAYNNYYAALKIFMHMIKCKYILFDCYIFEFKDEKNDSLKNLYKEKMQ